MRHEAHHSVVEAALYTRTLKPFATVAALATEAAWRHPAAVPIRSVAGLGRPGYHRSGL